MTDPRKEVEYVGENWCPIAAASSIIGKKWHLVIVHRLLKHGPLGFNALKEEVDGISGKVLSDSLDDLKEHDIVVREIISKKPVRVDYSLTEFGQSLEPVITAMDNWGEEYLKPIEGS